MSNPDESGPSDQLTMDSHIDQLCEDIKQLSPRHSDDEGGSVGTDHQGDGAGQSDHAHTHTLGSEPSRPVPDYHTFIAPHSVDPDNLHRYSDFNPRPPPHFDRNSIFEIRFKCTKDNYQLSPSCRDDLQLDDLVVVEADHGFDAGVIHAIRPPPTSVSPYLSSTAALRHVVGRATTEDILLVQQNHREEERALQLCRHLALVRHVPIVVAATEMQFDRKKLTIIFSSDRRVDFRELVRDMFQVFKTRIWMQKVSPAEAGALSYMFPTSPMPASRPLPLPQARSSRPVFTQSNVDNSDSLLDTYHGGQHMPPSLPPPRYGRDRGNYPHTRPAPYDHSTHDAGLPNNLACSNLYYPRGAQFYSSIGGRDGGHRGRGGGGAYGMPDRRAHPSPPREYSADLDYTHDPPAEHGLWVDSAVCYTRASASTLPAYAGGPRRYHNHQGAEAPEGADRFHPHLSAYGSYSIE